MIVILSSDAPTGKSLAGKPVYSFDSRLRPKGGLSCTVCMEGWEQIWDWDFVQNYVNLLQANAHGCSPIERLVAAATTCYSGGLIDDLRNNFHDLRGSTWPNARQLSILTGSDAIEQSSSAFGISLIIALRNDCADVTDLNGDGSLSTYELFNHAARNDFINPDHPYYTPFVPSTRYVTGESYVPGLCLDGCCSEHPLYYEWEGCVAGGAPTGARMCDAPAQPP